MAAPDDFDAALREARTRWPGSDWPDDVEGRLEDLWWSLTDAEQEEARRRAAAPDAGEE